MQSSVASDIHDIGSVTLILYTCTRCELGIAGMNMPDNLAVDHDEQVSTHNASIFCSVHMTLYIYITHGFALYICN